MGDSKKKKHAKKAEKAMKAEKARETAEPSPGNANAASSGEEANRTDLAAVQHDVLRTPPQMTCTIGALERQLLGAFPASDAEAWDHTGIMVGDPAQTVTGIAIALDPTVEAVRVAKRCGANVLITHHPVFIEAPTSVRPAGRGAMGSQTVVWEAVAQGVALMDFHTALDVSDEAARVLPSMLNLDFRRVVEVVHEASGRGYGQLCAPKKDEASMTLRTLAARCLSVFGRPARVWGSMDARLGSIVTCTGSAGDLTQVCFDRGYDCLVCGEVHYHDALAASQAGLCIIELGHDVSELPLCALLAATVEKMGFSDESIKVIDQGSNWSVPEAIRR